MKKTLFALTLTSITFTVNASNYVFDARNQGMGGAATAAANFLSAGFYNPSLAAMETNEANVGVIFPIIGARFRNNDDFIGSLEDFTDVYDGFTSNPLDANNQQNTADALRNLQNKQAIVSAGIGGAVGIPTKYLSGVLFIKGYTEGMFLPEIADTDINNIEAGTPPTSLDSKARVLGSGIFDLGLALAGKIDILGNHIAIGATPKVQKLYSYHYEVSINNFEFDEWTDSSNRTEESTMNLDIGAAWEQGPFRLGIAAKNLFAKEMTTAFRTRSYNFKLNPTLTVGSAFITPMLKLSADLDLNKQQRFSASSGPSIKDDTQLLRVGAEFNLANVVQLRAGYINDFESTLDGTITLGLGLGIDEIARIDVAAEIIDQDSLGAAVQLSFSI